MAPKVSSFVLVLPFLWLNLITVSEVCICIIVIVIIIIVVVNLIRRPLQVLSGAVQT